MRKPDVWSANKDVTFETLNRQDFLDAIRERAVGRKDRGGDCSSRPRLGKPTQAVDANVSVFDRMTDDEQRVLLAAFQALQSA
jgi:hypothetical protein